MASICEITSDSDKLMAAFEKKIAQAKSEASQARVIRENARKELVEERKKLEEQRRILKALKLKLSNKNPIVNVVPSNNTTPLNSIDEEENLPLVVQNISCKK